MAYADGGPAEEQSPLSRRAGHLLPLHRTPTSPLPSYPPLRHTWTRLQTWLSNEFTELGDTLNYGVQPDALAFVEDQLGVSLPRAVRESYLAVDGQEPESSSSGSEGLFFGLTLLPLEDVLAEWSFWREVDHDPATGANEHLRAQMRSVPPNWIRREYSCRGWLPLVTDRTGNYLGIDLEPGEGGACGQVIIFGRDFDTKVVLHSGEGEAGWATWLASFVDDLESGVGYELTGQQSDGGSDGSDDNVGYEGYFNSSGGRGGADGGQTLRLTGDYKGWNVLEAWADKNIRAWADVGMGLEGVEEENNQSGPNSGMGLGVLTMQGSTGAEIPIPVLREDEAAQISFVSPTAVASTRSTAAAPGHNITPSATVPPPQPIELPTRDDLSKHTLFAPLLEEASRSGPSQDSAELGLSSYIPNDDSQASNPDALYVESVGEDSTRSALLPPPTSFAARAYPPLSAPAQSHLEVSAPGLSENIPIPALTDVATIPETEPVALKPYKSSLGRPSSVITETSNQAYTTVSTDV